MKKTILSFLLLGFATFIFAQVGINNTAPKATLDVTAKTTDGSRPEGIIAPRLTGDQIKAGDAQYGNDQKGTIVYATSSVNSPSAKTIKINAEGYYYFDGSVWQKFINDSVGFIPTTRLVRRKTSDQITNNREIGTISMQVTELTDGNHNTSTETYTVPINGTYLISLTGSVIFGAPNVSDTSHVSQVTVNGVPIDLFRWTTTYSGLANTGPTLGGTTTMYLTAGSTIRPTFQNCNCIGSQQYTLRNYTFTIQQISR